MKANEALRQGKLGFYRTKDGRIAEVLFIYPEKYGVARPVHGVLSKGAANWCWDDLVDYLGGDSEESLETLSGRLLELEKEIKEFFSENRQNMVAAIPKITPNRTEAHVNVGY